MAASATDRALRWTAIVVAALLLSLLTVFNQVKTRGLSWHETNYRAHLESVAAGAVDGPAQYRVLSCALALAVAETAERMGVPRGFGAALVAFRVAQNTLLFLVALAFYRALGIPNYLGLLGLSVVAWGIAESNYRSGLAVDIYTEMIMFLAAGWAVLRQRWRWVPFLAVVAILNRESGALLPLMVLAGAFAAGTLTRPARNAVALSVIVVAAAIVGFRLYFGYRPMFGRTDDVAPGLPMLLRNLSHADTYARVMGTWTLLALIAIAGWRTAPSALRGMTCAVVPIWVLAVFLCGEAAQTRYLLLPLVLCLAPLALSAIDTARAIDPREGRASARPQTCPAPQPSRSA